MQASAKRPSAASPVSTPRGLSLLPGYRDDADHAADDAHDPPDVTEAATCGLRRVAAPVPGTALALSLVEFAERASYYGAGGVFANFVQRPLPPGSTTGAPVREGDTPGAMGLGLRVSAALTTTFTMLAFSSPMVSPGAAERSRRLLQVAAGEERERLGGALEAARAVGRRQGKDV